MALAPAALAMAARRRLRATGVVGPTAASQRSEGLGRRGSCRPRRMVSAALGDDGEDASQLGGSAPSSSGLEALEALATSLELAERSASADVGPLQQRLAEAEAEQPVAAMLFRQRKQVATLLDIVLFESGDEAAQARHREVDAVRALCRLGSPPAAAMEAEEALHRILRGATGSVCAAAESALWDIWQCAGDEEIDEKFRRAVKMLGARKLTESIKLLTEVIATAPTFAEGWNKRATALYMRGILDRSIDDCMEVLKLKPKHFGCLSGLGMIYQKKGDEKEALKWFRKAVAVNPGMEQAQRHIQSAIVQERLSPMVAATVEALSAGTEVETPVSEAGVLSDWDVHRVTPNDASLQACVYFFRVRVRNAETSSRAVRSLARFYVLRFKDGKVVPFARLTDGEASFVLRPGQEYRYCWALVVGSELHEMAGGVLMERHDFGGGPPSVDENGSHDAEQYPRARMEPALSPHASSQITMGDIKHLGEGYYYTGQLDLRSGFGSSA